MAKMKNPKTGEEIEVEDIRIKDHILAGFEMVDGEVPEIGNQAPETGEDQSDAEKVTEGRGMVIETGDESVDQHPAHLGEEPPLPPSTNV